ncbi:serine hydrolase domain-containing protein [Corallibacter sp.]|uniref:serine hydrolase domain-containing protein n=1 Tax=Corallibacter sp. TaxID=2038084 RepID=UPI003AB13DD0
MRTIPFSIIICALLLCNCSSNDNENIIINTPETSNPEIYFPPLNSDEWESKTPESLNWNSHEISTLLNYLEEKNTKGFMILHNGKIVIEAYMNQHSESSSWYWASAGKTLTSTLAGIAEDEDLIALNNKVSDYIGDGWTSLSLEKENLITCKHLLSMTSGIDDTQGANVSAENMQYTADAGTRWAYHNVYVKMQDVIAQSSGNSWNDYFNIKLKNKIGMTGSWIAINDLNVFWSTTRSMARFGLLIYANGMWNNTRIVSNSYLNQATNTSQNINLAYGYLWWLNGKSSYHLPQSQFEFPGKLIPNAPDDMFAALGKNDQKIYVVPSKKLVIIRMGESADDENFALSTFDNDLWEKINTVIN